MNSEHFQLQKNTSLDSHFALESDLTSPHFFETYKDELTAYGIFSIGVISLLGSGFYVIEHFNPVGQTLGWSGVALSTATGFYGANLIDKLDSDIDNDENKFIL